MKYTIHVTIKDRLLRLHESGSEPVFHPDFSLKDYKIPLSICGTKRL